jgi:hypothetical protein
MARRPVFCCPEASSEGARRSLREPLRGRRCAMKVRWNRAREGRRRRPEPLERVEQGGQEVHGVLSPASRVGVAEPKKKSPAKAGLCLLLAGSARAYSARDAPCAAFLSPVALVSPGSGRFPHHSKQPEPSSPGRERHAEDCRPRRGRRNAANRGRGTGADLGRGSGSPPRVRRSREPDHAQRLLLDGAPSAPRPSMRPPTPTAFTRLRPTPVTRPTQDRG